MFVDFKLLNWVIFFVTSSIAVIKSVKAFANSADICYLISED